MPETERTPCSTCAFGQAGAAKEPFNALRAEICAAGAVPFWCHRGFDWRTGEPPPPAQLVICRGWQAKVAEHNRGGRYADRKLRGVRYWLAQNTLIMIDAMVTAVEAADREYFLRQIKHGGRRKIGACVRRLKGLPSQAPDERQTSLWPEEESC